MNEWLIKAALVVLFLIGILIIGIVLMHSHEKAEEQMMIKRKRFIATELIPEIRDAVLEVIVESNEETMEMIPEKLKDIRKEMERE